MKSFVSTPVSDPAACVASMLGKVNLVEKLETDFRRGLSVLELGDDAYFRQLTNETFAALKDGDIQAAREVVKPVRSSFWDHFRDRSGGLVDWLAGPFREIYGLDLPTDVVVDWGSGKGSITKKLQQQLPKLSFHCADKLNYNESDLPFELIADGNEHPAETGSVRAASLIYVLHHDPNPATILAELKRIIVPGGRLIVVELVPEDGANLDEELARMYFSDFLFCQVWQDLDIPMPGSYKSVPAWLELFGTNSFRQISRQTIDGTPLIYGNRKMFVFQR